MTIQHKNIPEAELHEIKGASTATINHVASSNGDGTTSFKAPVIMGWYNYDHNGATVPLTLAATDYDLINDTLGSQTFTYGQMPGAPTVWNSITNRFDFTNLAIGDTLDFRIDLIVTTGTTNVDVDIVYELAVGTGSPILVPLTTARGFSTAGSYQITLPLASFLGSTLVKNNPARLKARSNKVGTVVAINGWYVRVIRAGDHL